MIVLSSTTNTVVPH